MRLVLFKLVPNGEIKGVQTELADKGCPIVTIEQAVDMIPNGVPLLAKIDIEGFVEGVVRRK